MKHGCNFEQSENINVEKLIIESPIFSSNVYIQIYGYYFQDGYIKKVILATELCRTCESEKMSNNTVPSRVGTGFFSIIVYILFVIMIFGLIINWFKKLGEARTYEQHNQDNQDNQHNQDNQDQDNQDNQPNLDNSIQLHNQNIE